MDFPGERSIERAKNAPIKDLFEEIVELRCPSSSMSDGNRQYSLRGGNGSRDAGNGLERLRGKYIEGTQMKVRPGSPGEALLVNAKSRQSVWQSHDGSVVCKPQPHVVVLDPEPQWILRKPEPASGVAPHDHRGGGNLGRSP